MEHQFLVSNKTAVLALAHYDITWGLEARAIPHNRLITVPFKTCKNGWESVPGAVK